ncbi:radical SAM protein [Eubacteriales bacterium OttesenSCG-928-K08]|nr:radical SAM protein [Eubacteriales bacterium OttesenSCG-928-K08]
MSAHTLAEIFLRLEEQGAHNINLVTPTPHISTIREALILAKEEGLSIPTVYNTGGYDSVDALKSLDGLIDIYLPDLKYVCAQKSQRYSSAPNYFEHASAALNEMFRQVGHLKLDKNSIALKGMLIRHLVLPGNLKNTRDVLKYILETYSKGMFVSLMGQYFPPSSTLEPPLNRRLTQREYESAVDECIQLGFNNVYIQSISSATETYVPQFYDDPINNY